jgi:hypothetical protein
MPSSSAWNPPSTASGSSRTSTADKRKGGEPSQGDKDWLKKKLASSDGQKTAEKRDVTKTSQPTTVNIPSKSGSSSK